MLQFYYNAGPNPMKVALFLEEAGLKYEPLPVDMLKGEQFAPAFLAINPNAKLPAIVDGDVTVFDSNAILLYLAEKTGRFIPHGGARARGELLSWLMFVATGIGPYSGQSVHFRHAAPDPKDYAVNRYKREVERHYRIVDQRLAERRYMLDDVYTIVDMALWGWARMIPRVLGEDGFDAFPHVKRFLDEISARPAAQAAEALRAGHAWKTEFDAEARRFMFPQNEPAQ
jgi:GSH-dependent disulfide-bond oxidoreductase